MNEESNNDEECEDLIVEVLVVQTLTSIVELSSEEEEFIDQLLTSMFPNNVSRVCGEFWKEQSPRSISSMDGRFYR